MTFPLPTSRRLLDLTAADLMSRAVTTLTPPLSVRAAAHLLTQAGVTGAPVVDELGRCIGVVSTTDLVRFVDQGPAAVRRFDQPSDCFCSEWEVEEREALPPDDVSRFMTTDVVATSPDTSIRELARIMVDAHIHRVVVLDGARHPIGVVSSMDVLAAVAREESDSPLESGELE